MFSFVHGGFKRRRNQFHREAIAVKDLTMASLSMAASFPGPIPNGMRTRLVPGSLFPGCSPIPEWPETRLIPG